MVPKQYFANFVAQIRLQKSHIEDARTGHTTLRERLLADESVSPIVEAVFLQGSYRRGTAIRPKAGARADVDVVVVTNLVPDVEDPVNGVTARQAIERFVPFVKEHYPDRWRRQGRSIGIELSYVDLDLVVTALPGAQSAEALARLASWSTDDYGLLGDYPDESDESPFWRDSVGAYLATLSEAASSDSWRAEPLWLPDRDADEWEPTHPLAQITWTWGKNAATSGHYTNTVKALKWWRRTRHPETEHPKGYPLEHMVGDCCPDGIDSLEECVADTLCTMRDRYASYAAAGTKPRLPDRGVPEHDVLERLSVEEFATFCEQVCAAAETAGEAIAERDSYESAVLWQKLLGNEFPVPEPPKSNRDDEPQSPANPGRASFA